MAKSNVKYFLVFVFASFIILFLGCDKENNQEETKFEILSKYLLDNNLDLPYIHYNWLTTACTVNTTGVENFFIIDLRNNEEFNLGHIEGAVNTNLDNMLNVVQSAGNKPILIVCETGQKSAYAHVALRLSGYANCQVLMYGMSAWNSDFDVLTTKTSNQAIGHQSWDNNQIFSEVVEFEPPEIITASETGENILKNRVQYIVTSGYENLDALFVLNNCDDYFINCYLSKAEVEPYGHITGAYQIKENLSLTSCGYKFLDPSAEHIIYCWSGQTSALVSAYLKVLGYDARTLDFGLNALIYDQLETHSWIESENFNYVIE